MPPLSLLFNTISALSYIYNVAEVSFVGASVKAELNEDEVKGTASLTLEVNYKASVAKISSADKEKAVDFMSLMGGGMM